MQQYRLLQLSGVWLGRYRRCWQLRIEVVGEFQWYRNDEPIAGAKASSITLDESGVYTLKITRNGCTILSDEVEFVVTGIESPLSNAIEVYPVPAQSTVIIRFNNNAGKPDLLELINMQGQRLQPQIKASDADGLLMDVSTLPSGMYMLRTKQNGVVATCKMAVQ